MVPWRPTTPRARVEEDSRQRTVSRALGALGQKTAATVAAGIDLDRREAQGDEPLPHRCQALGHPGNPARLDLDTRAPPPTGAVVANPPVAPYAELPQGRFPALHLRQPLRREW